MKDRKALTFTRLMYIIFIIGTIISLFIVYKDIDGNLAHKFVIGYGILAFFMLIYIPIITIFKLKRLKWNEVSKRLIKFVLLFLLLSSIKFVFYYFFRSEDIDYYRVFSSALGVSFGISFIDIILDIK